MDDDSYTLNDISTEFLELLGGDKLTNKKAQKYLQRLKAIDLAFQYDY